MCEGTLPSGDKYRGFLDGQQESETKLDRDLAWGRHMEGDGHVTTLHPEPQAPTHIGWGLTAQSPDVSIHTGQSNLFSFSQADGKVLVSQGVSI